MKIRALMTAMACTLVACSEKDNTQHCVGFGTVERTDSTCLLHYYELALDAEGLQSTNLEDDARVYFEAEILDNLDAVQRSYKAKLIKISEDIRQDIHGYGTDKAEATCYGTALCATGNIHITRDWKRNDYFNITTYYATQPDNDDHICLLYDAAEQHDAEADSIPTYVLWLRHYQKKAVANDQIEYKSISVPINSLRLPDDKYILIEVKQFGPKGDTLSTTYGYSY